MKKITIILLISSTFMMAQTKSVVTKFGEIVNINPFVNNGLTAVNGYIQLGGALTQPSVLTTDVYTLALLGIPSGTASDNILVNDPATGILKKTTTAALIANAWRITGNAGIDPSIQFLGTPDANDLVFQTNLVERLRMPSTGLVGIGTAAPTKALEITAATNPLKLNGLQAGNTATDNIVLTDNTGILKTTLTPDVLLTPVWKTTGNTGTTAGTNFIGTIDAQDQVFKTNSVERIRISNTNGFTGIGLPNNTAYGTTPNYMLDVVDDVHISSSRIENTSARLIMENQNTVAGSTDLGVGMYVLDGQNNGSRRQWFMGKGYLPEGTGGNDNFMLTSGLTDNLNYSYAQATNTNVKTHLYVDGKNNHIGIGTINPTTALEISSNGVTPSPLKLNGLQAGTATDDIVLVDNTGVLKTLARNIAADNLGNHTATMTLNMSNYDITNVKNLSLKSDLRIYDSNTSFPNPFVVNKNNGNFSIGQDYATPLLTINETTSKTNVLRLQITQGTDGNAPVADYIAAAADTNGNVIWKPVSETTGAVRLQFNLQSTGLSADNSDTYTDVPGLSNYTYVAPSDGILMLQSILYSMITGPVTITTTPVMAKTQMKIFVNGMDIDNTELIATNTGANSADYQNGGTMLPETSNINVQIPVTKGQTYVISVQARTVEKLSNGGVGTSVGTYTLDDVQIPSTLVGTLYNQ